MRLKTLALAMAVLAIAPAFAPAPARAEIEVDVNRGDAQPLPIAIPAFGGGQVGADIAKVITNNLEGSGLFRPIDPNAFIQRDLNVAYPPQFPDWKAINAQALLYGQATVEGDRLNVEFRLSDVFASQELVGMRFTASPESWRKVAHKISDVVYERLTGEKGYFDTEVAFVAESGPRTKKVTRLAIMDQDGANPRYLTDGAYMVMTPRFSPTRREITYMELMPDRSAIWLLSLETGRREKLGDFTGMVFSPRFSPDGSRVAFSQERSGNSDIYVMDLRTRSPSRLTNDPSIDTSPSFSPDGSQIVFNSDRGGSPQLYVMSAGGGGARRISFGDGRYTTPVWSPTGDYIAFTKQVGGTFHIGVMRPDGSSERILTSSYLDEGPTWAPNGRVLMFFRESPGGAPRLWTVDVTGRISRPNPREGSGSDPAWSPLLN